MAASFTTSHGSWVGQSILNLLAASARRASDYSRLQGLSRRYLDDAGVTPAEFEAALGNIGVVGQSASAAALAHSV